ncbi:hypothetical protein DdX_11937 [Ditylenchus destructor]|uniref:Uncharacterized protein n=1 Tax=Ditylenchus destructor TaxID=166010 RepID=A0AAD4R0T0_9BILA|nr:hypothetical protein DdX_11937 [Ditylenchus destructor]
MSGKDHSACSRRRRGNECRLSPLHWMLTLWLWTIDEFKRQYLLRLGSFAVETFSSNGASTFTVFRFLILSQIFLSEEHKMTTIEQEFENMKKGTEKLQANCYQMVIKQQKEQVEKVHELQQRYGMINADLQSKNSELQTQLEQKTKECEQTVAKLDEKEKVILEARNCETDLRSELQNSRAQKEQIEKNFKKVSAELDKTRNERKAAQDRLEQCKNFVDHVGRNCADFARQVENIGPVSPVLQMKRTPPDANQHEQGTSPSKRSKR